jgi:hypothetical protein
LLSFIIIFFSASLSFHWLLWTNGVWIFFYLNCICFFLIFVRNVI